MSIDNDKKIEYISKRIDVSDKNIIKTVELLEDGSTIPFIARYRKEMTGGLDEVQIGKIKQLAEEYEGLEERREYILKTIDNQGKLTNELKDQIQNTNTLSVLEDLYLPYKKKRKTKATKAKQKGLEPLAKKIFSQKDFDVAKYAEEFINDEVNNIDEAIQGARDIIAEWINEDINVRESIRDLFKNKARIISKVKKSKIKEAEKFKDYFDSAEKLSTVPSHRLLAMRRGESEEYLRIKIAPPEKTAISIIEKEVIKSDFLSAQQVKIAIEDSYKRLLKKSIENEYANISKKKADKEAIDVFNKNLRQLLLAPPLGEKEVMAIDPGFRTGCKVVCLDKNGNLLDNTVIYPDRKQSEAKKKILNLIKKYNIKAIGIGNGTASRQTEKFIKDLDLDVEVFIVNESGASIYSASEIAREEFPDQDITVRGAVSIGRRLMDPLAELVKLDPKSIGVGQYQHDVDQTSLKESLDRTVESVVNQVGINLNTASKHLLMNISGLGEKLAENIIEYRNLNGEFKNRKELKKVHKLGPKSFEQSAGFLRIKNGTNPLDNSGVHPESYKIVEKIAKDYNIDLEDLIGNEKLIDQIDLNKYVTEIVGLPTLKDIAKELKKPGLDPRGKAKSFSFKQGVNEISDLEEGMVLPGIVTNITNFGAFVDIGVHQDGLVHISQMADKYVDNPANIVDLNQKIEVKVMEIDTDRKRISLSMLV